MSRHIAYLLPRSVLYWAVIRVWAYLTTEVWPDRTPDSITVWDALGTLDPR